MSRRIFNVVRSAWSLVQLAGWAMNSAAPLCSREYRHFGVRVLDDITGGVSFCCRGCTSVAIVDLKASEAKGAAEELATYACG